MARNQVRALMIAAAVTALAGCAETKALLAKVGSGQPAAEAAKPVEKPDFSFCPDCLIDGAGHVVPRSTTVQGDLERADKTDGRVVLTGWASDASAGTPPLPAKWVLLVSNGTIIAAVAPDQPRPDISTKLQQFKSVQFGFQIGAPESDFGPVAAIWVVGADGKAAPLDKALRR